MAQEIKNQYRQKLYEELKSDYELPPYSEWEKTMLDPEYVQQAHEHLLSKGYDVSLGDLYKSLDFSAPFSNVPEPVPTKAKSGWQEMAEQAIVPPFMKMLSVGQGVPKDISTPRQNLMTLGQVANAGMAIGGIPASIAEYGYNRATKEIPGGEVLNVARKAPLVPSMMLAQMAKGLLPSNGEEQKTYNELGQNVASQLPFLGTKAVLDYPSTTNMYKRGARLPIYDKDVVSVANKGGEPNVVVNQNVPDVIASRMIKAGEPMPRQKNMVDTKYKWTKEVNDIAQNKLRKTFKSIDEGGYKQSVDEIAQVAEKNIREKYKGLTGEDALARDKVLGDLVKAYKDVEGDYVNAERMQDTKTAVHRMEDYEGKDMPSLRDAWNVEIARQYREKLEQIDPRVKFWNEKLRDKIIMLENLDYLGSKSPKSTMTSMPFYMAVGEPVRGALFSEARGLVTNPFMLTKSAIAIDKLRGGLKYKQSPFLIPRDTTGVVKFSK